MSERPPQTQASIATEAAARQADARRQSASGRPDPAPAGHGSRAATQPAGVTLATRAARFRNGAPFLVERATLYDPYPLDPLPVVEVNTLPRPRQRSLLPAALTLLGIVIVVGLSAGVLFVRNADGPRRDDRALRNDPSGGPVATRKSPGVPPGAVPYDLTRRSEDTITGAWRFAKELEARTDEARAPEGPAAAPPPVAAAPPPPPPAAPRRAMPQRLAMPPRTPQPEARVAEPQAPPRAPLDEPHVPKAVVEDVPRANGAREPVQTGTVERNPPVALQQTAPPPSDRSGPNVVARVGRTTDTPDAEHGQGSRRTAMPIRPERDEAKRRDKGGAMSRRELRAHLQRMRKAARDAQDVDRFELRAKGDIPKGFVYSGPQGQRP